MCGWLVRVLLVLLLLLLVCLLDRSIAKFRSFEICRNLLPSSHITVAVHVRAHPFGAPMRQKPVDLLHVCVCPVVHT